MKQHKGTSTSLSKFWKDLTPSCTRFAYWDELSKRNTQKKFLPSLGYIPGNLITLWLGISPGIEQWVPCEWGCLHTCSKPPSKDNSILIFQAQSIWTMYLHDSEHREWKASILLLVRSQLPQTARNPKTVAFRWAGNSRGCNFRRDITRFARC